MNIDTLFGPGQLDKAIEAGNVRTQQHPELPLTIANYTEMCAYEGNWDQVTLTCRGLIYDQNGEILARPFAKFFNHGQDGCATIPLDAPVHVTDKMDGSLGILYPTPDGWAVATRGSFASEQAQHATKLLRDRYPDFWPTPGFTYLFEIIYPANRIVVNYGDTDDLVGLGMVDIETGWVHGGGAIRIGGWRGPVTTTFGCATFAEALAMTPRENREGIVVRDMNTGAMVKIKQDDYVRLHRIVTGLNARKVWEHLMSGAPLDELIAPIPDEFHAWVRDVADGIIRAVDEREADLFNAYANTVAGMPDGWTPEDRAGRKTFAAVAARHPDKWALFHLLDGRDIRGELMKRADPGPNVTPTTIHGQDNN